MEIAALNNFFSRFRFILFYQNLKIYSAKTGWSLIYMLIWTGFLVTRLYISSLPSLCSHPHRIISSQEALGSLKFNGISGIQSRITISTV